MEAKELRIGNWVKHKYSGVVSIDLHALSLVNIQSSEKIDIIYQPILLTEEWLLKFGFEKRITENISIQYFTGENPITRDWLFEILWLNGYEFPFYRNGCFQIKYVHQLQNLYFALTNQEL